MKGELQSIDAYVSELTLDEVDELNLDPDVEYVEHDMPVFANTLEPSFNWGLDNMTPPIDGNYEYKLTGRGVEAYIFDSGIRATHQNFGGRVAQGQTWVFDGRGTDDALGHGTHVAGIVGGIYSGVAKAVTLIPMRLLDVNGWGQISDIMFAFEYLIDRKSKGKYKRTPMVVNMSIGFSGRSQSLDSSINAACDKNIIVVVAAGNYNGDACYYSPSSAAKAIVVGALNQDNSKAVYSNSGQCVDIWAGGTVIQSSWNGSDMQYVYKSGTSMASPFVAGAAALMLEANPQLRIAEIAQTLKDNASITAQGLLALNTSFLL